MVHTVETAKAAFSARLHEALDFYPGAPSSHGRAAWLSRHVPFKVSPKGAGKWLNAESIPTRENMLLLADSLDVSRAWLSDGEGNRQLARRSRHHNVEAAPVQSERRMAPVIDYITAGSWGEATDPYPPGVGETFEPIYDSDPDEVFWLRVKGDSMTGPPGAQSIPEGYLIKVDPCKEAQNGSLVVAKLVDSNEATFKKYVEDAGMKFLKPLNPDYPTIAINGNCRIVGVVTEAKVKLSV